MPFTKEYLKDYEEKIRKLPLEELYDILSVIRDNPFKADDTLERVKIVEKRIEELENKPQSKGKSNSSTRRYYNIPYKNRFSSFAQSLKYAQSQQLSSLAKKPSHTTSDLLLTRFF